MGSQEKSDTPEPEETSPAIENTVPEEVTAETISTAETATAEISSDEANVPENMETAPEQPVTSPKPERVVSHNYNDIDPMFGPPPDMSAFSGIRPVHEPAKLSREEKKRLKEERKRQKAEAKQQKKKLKKEK